MSTIDQNNDIFKAKRDPLNHISDKETLLNDELPNDEFLNIDQSNEEIATQGYTVRNGYDPNGPNPDQEKITNDEDDLDDLDDDFHTEKDLEHDDYIEEDLDDDGEDLNITNDEFDNPSDDFNETEDVLEDIDEDDDEDDDDDDYKEDDVQEEDEEDDFEEDDIQEEDYPANDPRRF
ncbi:MAG: hypothetical protein ABI576_08485 [Flavobacterium sp.]